MKKILITGAGGYIASHAANFFLDKGYQVVAIDNLSTGYLEPLKKLEKKFTRNNFKFYIRDLRENLDDIFKEDEVDAVIHYAAFCSVDESVKHPEMYFSNNTCASQNLFSAMIRNKINKLIFSSTCNVYGEPKYMPVDEKHITNPNNPYGESKLITEKIIQSYGRFKDLKYMILRYFNITGAWEDGEFGDSKKPSTLLVQNAIRGALGIEQFSLTCSSVDTLDKTPIRDLINVVDLAEAHWAALKCLGAGKTGEIINLGTGTGYSVLEVIHEVQKRTGKRIEFKKGTPRKGEYARMVASIDKAYNLLGWKPKRTLADSIDSLVKWYEKYPQGWVE